ncbi:MAG: hypothetical protein FE045_03335 [Thermoplasmata archaeon]|nr:MAG: hypothetical protein FE045_03335 [Thermoplasmata archaeon]
MLSLKYDVAALVDSKLQKFCMYINKVRQQDEDFIMLITGQTRSGKSTLAIEMAMLMDSEFEMERQVLFDMKELGKRIYESKGKVFILDEAIFDAFNREAMSMMNRWLIKIFTVCAERNHVIIMIIPKINWLDKPVKERIAFMFYTMKQYTTQGVKRGIYKAYDWTDFNPFEDSEFPRYAWMGKFQQLPPTFYAKYSELKLENVKKRLDIENENPLAMMSKTAIARAILNDPRFNVSKKDLQPIFGNVVYRL